VNEEFSSGLLVPASEACEVELLTLEVGEVQPNVKAGVLLCVGDQTDERDMFSNGTPLSMLLLVPCLRVCHTWI